MTNKIYLETNNKRLYSATLFNKKTYHDLNKIGSYLYHMQYPASVNGKVSHRDIKKHSIHLLDRVDSFKNCK